MGQLECGHVGKPKVYPYVHMEGVRGPWCGQHKNPKGRPHPCGVGGCVVHTSMNPHNTPLKARVGPSRAFDMPESLARRPKADE